MMYLLYFALWVIFNGTLTVEIAVFGIVIAAVVFAFTCKFMDYSLEKEKKLWKNAGRLLVYSVILVLEIVKANLVVVRIILTQKEEIQPVMIRFRTKLKNPVWKAFLGNAITLTPGTITAGLEDDIITVHCLDERMAPGIDSSVFVERLKELEKNS